MIAPLTQRVGNFEFTVVRSDLPPDRPRRAPALADWLLSQWRKEQEARRDDTANRN